MYIAYIRAIPNDFIFQFFPAFHTTLNEDLRTQTKTLGRKITKFFRIVCKSRTKTTEGESRTQNNRVTNSLGSLKSSIYGGYSSGLRDGYVNFLIRIKVN